MKKPEKLQIANKKASIIVLVVAAVFLIYSHDFLNGIEEHFTASADGILAIPLTALIATAMLTRNGGSNNPTGRKKKAKR